MPPFPRRFSKLEKRWFTGIRGNARGLGLTAAAVGAEAPAENRKMDTSDLFGSEEALAPEQRERVGKFYGELEIALFERERAEHLDLCRTLAGAARRNRDEARARKIAERFREWDERHLRAFLKETLAGSHASAKEASRV